MKKGTDYVFVFIDCGDKTIGKIISKNKNSIVKLTYSTCIGTVKC